MVLHHDGCVALCARNHDDIRDVSACLLLSKVVVSTFVGWGAVRCSALRCDSMRCDATGRSVLLCSAALLYPLPCPALLCYAMLSFPLPSPPLPSSALLRSALLSLAALVGLIRQVDSLVIARLSRSAVVLFRKMASAAACSFPANPRQRNSTQLDTSLLPQLQPHWQSVGL